MYLPPIRLRNPRTYVVQVRVGGKKMGNLPDPVVTVAHARVHPERSSVVGDHDRGVEPTAVEEEEPITAVARDSFGVREREPSGAFEFASVSVSNIFCPLRSPFALFIFLLLRPGWSRPPSSTHPCLPSPPVCLPFFTSSPSAVRVRPRLSPSALPLLPCITTVIDIRLLLESAFSSVCLLPLLCRPVFRAVSCPHVCLDARPCVSTINPHTSGPQFIPRAKLRYVFLVVFWPPFSSYPFDLERHMYCAKLEEELFGKAFVMLFGNTLSGGLTRKEHAAATFFLPCAFQQVLLRDLQHTKRKSSAM